MAKFAYIQESRYELHELNAGLFELTWNGAFIAKLVSEEECRRVIWYYWTNLGKNIEPLTEEDFDDI